MVKLSNIGAPARSGSILVREGNKGFSVIYFDLSCFGPRGGGC